MKLIQNYMRDDALRHQLNELTQEVFGFHFEDWVTGGYYEGDYIPYSYEEDGRLIANVSANRMVFLQNGEEKCYIQLGTVMTREAYRNRGYASALMKQVIAQYHGKCDGIYLYGNVDALDFYDKLGFARGAEYRYFLDARQPLKKAGTPFCRAEGEAHKAHYQEMVRAAAANSAFEQQNKYGLQMFYTADMGGIFYSQELDCYIALEQEGSTLLLQSVIADRKIPLVQILERIPTAYDTLMLGFTPCQEDGALFREERYDGGEDYRFFFLGEDLKSVETQKLYFPVFSHA